MSLEKFGTKGAFGSACEDQGRQWLKEIGFYVLPLSMIENGGAPLLESQIQKEIAPDILASRQGASILVDVKGKSRASRNRTRDRIETGCELRHYHAYMAVGRIMGMRVALLFIHADRSEMHFGYLDEISLDAFQWTPGPDWFKSHPNHEFKEPMIFFNIDPNHGSRFDVCFRKEDFLTAKLRAAAMPPKTVRPWEPRHKTPGSNGQTFLPGW
jgi:hypothetical protein